MRDIRIGNDIKVRWSLFLKGTDEPFYLSRYPVTLYLKNMYGRKQVTDFAVMGNLLEWTFFGKDQRHTGKHSLVLVVNEGVEVMMTTDACDFVNLVPCTCVAGGGEDACGVEIETVEIKQNLDLFNDSELLNEVLSTCCSLDFNDDFNNDFTIGL